MADDAHFRKRITLKGKRFDGGRLPIDSLSELERYQDAIRVVAQYEWLHDHPGEPLPADFRDSMSLTIEKIDEGSADVYLAFEQIAVYREYHDQAQDSIDGQMAAAYAGGDLPPLVVGAEDEVRTALAAFGSTLEADQAIEFYVDDGPHAEPVQITQATHEEAATRFMRDNFLIAAAPPLNVAQENPEMTVVGRVTVLNAEQRSFELRTEEHGKLKFFYKQNPTILDDLRAFVDEAEQGPLTRVHGTARIKDGQVWRFNETHSIERVEFDASPEGERLASFAALSRGWAGGEGIEISSVALDAAQALLRLLPASDPSRTMAPTGDGGIQFEWITSGGLRAVEVLGDGSFETFVMRATDRTGTLDTVLDVRAVAAFVTGQSS